MIIQGVNTTSGTLTYSSENVTISANSTVTISPGVVIAFSSDPQVYSDIVSGNLNISDSIFTYSGQAAVQFLRNAAEMQGNLDKPGLGSITAQQPSLNTPVANATVVATTSGTASCVFNITGTWSATLNIDAQNGDGFWFPVAGISPSSGNQFTAFISNLQVIVPCGGYAQVRIRCSAYTSGTVSVTYNAGLGLNYVNQGITGSLPSAWAMKLTESTGTYTAGIESRGGQYISPLDGFRATYSASTSITMASSATDLLTITGSSTKTVRIINIRITMGAATASTQNMSLIVRSAANSGGTSATVTAVPHDSNDAAATAVVKSYTANATSLGASVGTIRQERIEATTSGGNVSPPVIWDFGDRPGKAVVLRGTSQILAINAGGSTPTTGTFQVAIEWTEE